jgi:hypothetical protein
MLGGLPLALFPGGLALRGVVTARLSAALSAGASAGLASGLVTGCGINIRRGGQAAPGEAPRIEVEAAHAAVQAGRAVLVDVRGSEAWRRERAAGALDLPYDQITANPSEAARRLPAGKQAILYCT